MPTLNGKLCQCLRKYGFKISEIGVCSGVSDLLAIADLQGQNALKTFLDRMELLKQLDQNQIIAILDNKNPDNAAQRTDLMAFFNLVALLQEPMAFRQLYDTEMEGIAQYVALRILQSLNLLPVHFDPKGIDSPYAFTIPVTPENQEEQFLSNITARALQVSRDYPEANVVFALSNELHRMQIIYDKDNSEWVLWDINEGGGVVRSPDSQKFLKHAQHYLKKVFKDHHYLTITPICINNVTSKIALQKLSDLNNAFHQAILTHGSQSLKKCAIANLRDALRDHRRDEFQYILQAFPQLLLENAESGENGLQAAARSGKTELLKELVQSLSVDVDKPGSDEIRASFMSALYGDLRTLKYLISVGANVQSENGKTKDTLLHAAAKYGRMDVVDYLIDKVNLNQKNSNGLSAIAIAALNGHLNVVQVLLDQGADVDNEALSSACLKGDEDIVNLLLTKINPSQLNTLGMFYTACKGGSVALVKKIGDELEIDSDYQAFVIVCQKGHVELTKYLLKAYGSSFIQQGMKGACEFGHLDVVNFLLPHIETDLARSMDAEKAEQIRAVFFDVACKSGNLDLVKRLVSSNCCKISPFLPPTFVQYPTKALDHLLSNGSMFKDPEDLDLAYKSDKFELVELFFKKMAANGDTPLHMALKRGYVNCLDFLLDNPESDIDKKNDLGLTALDIAQAKTDISVEEKTLILEKLQRINKSAMIEPPLETLQVVGVFKNKISESKDSQKSKEGTILIASPYHNGPDS